jgi:DNA (cytosine-5)-methyltransferase 1
MTSNKLKVLDLFSGIGGFSLGLERTGGFETVAFCEIDLQCQKVLKRHWPSVTVFNDVETLTKEDLQKEVDLICGGFPCQDISLSGKGDGLDGERSGLWFEYLRIISQVRPKYAVIENVSALLGRGLGTILGNLAEIGYDAEWHCIPASAIGAPHQRDRIWIVAYTNHKRWKFCWKRRENGNKESRELFKVENYLQEIENPGDNVSNTNNVREQIQPGWFFSTLEMLGGLSTQRKAFRTIWATESGVCRVANGIPSRVDRIKQLGNAIVPQIAEIIGLVISQHELVMQKEKECTIDLHAKQA